MDDKKTITITIEEYNLLLENQKQVDELKAENTELYKEHTTLIAGSILKTQDIVKETVKEYHDAVKKLFDDVDCCGWIEDSETKYWHEGNDKIARERFGVEVE